MSWISSFCGVDDVLAVYITASTKLDLLFDGVEVLVKTAEVNNSIADGR